MSDTYQPKVYRRQGGDEMVVADGGKIIVETGGAIEIAGEDNLVAVDFDADYFEVEGGEVTLGDAVAKGTAVANIPAATESTGVANNADVATVVALKTEHDALVGKINAIIAALEEFGIALDA